MPRRRGGAVRRALERDRAGPDRGHGGHGPALACVPRPSLLLPALNDRLAGKTGADAYSGKGAPADGLSQIPLGRMGGVADIAAAAVFQFSPAATWITGTIVVVDGGERHMSLDVLPYPQATLDPPSVKHMIAAKL
jgi:hypothetical protein